MKRLEFTIAAGLAILLAFNNIALWAQATSQIQGVVHDASGAAIGGAEVKATQTDTGVVRTVASSEDGGLKKTNGSLGTSCSSSAACSR